MLRQLDLRSEVIKLDTVILEVGERGVIVIPREIQERCGFSPYQQVVVEEHQKEIVVKLLEKEPRKINEFPETLEGLLSLPAGSLSHLSSGPDEVGDFKDEDIS